MKRFHFPLERVRRWRSEQASLEELKLQQLRAQLASLGSEKYQVQEDLAQNERQLFAERSLTSIDLESLDSYRFYVRGRVRDLEQRERACEEKITNQRRQVIEARRSFELLDRLRTGALQHWTAAAAKEQEDLAAELFLSRDRRNPA